MIQRIQSLYLLISFALCTFLIVVDPSILTISNNNVVTRVAYINNYVGEIHNLKIANLLALIAIGGTSLFSIFLYKKLPLQKRMANYLIILTGIFMVVLIIDYIILKNQLPSIAAYPGFHIIWIIAVFVMLVLARFNIVKDIKLLASMDRIR